MRALLEVTLVNSSAIIADGIGDVEREVVATLLSSHAEQLAVLCLRQVLLKVAVQSRSTCQVLNILDSVQTETVNHVKRIILNLVEVAVVAVTRYYIAVLLVPLGILYTHILGWNHLTIEHHTLTAVLLIQFFYDSQNGLHIFCVTRVVTYLYTQELSRLYKSVYANGQVLAADVDVT